ncbi:16S rRNA (cytosine(1402)-N(4))-methyltransferase RsmH [Nannocystis sp.]|uniref:16S rRNA (cytosine(1402)-N(4))-methyltransferase RsmH n=1 Tax=Nannocystis sp. TaxID=1962667 RepID=UPI0025E0719C|nr:16S rRNA (cytosine(1402)-N(4))-methyltransferase RsmH [Nannocystis sp.]
MSGAYHLPVLVHEVCAALLPPLRRAASARPLAPAGPILVDCTCGGAGHSEALLRGLVEHTQPGDPPPRFLALDRDPDALAHAHARVPALELFHRPFSQLAAVLDEASVPAATAILADLGVSSHQLDTGERGFSFQADAPLDMRMDPTRGVPLSLALADLDHPSLTRILRELGEEPDAARIARGILAARPQTTRALADVVRASMSAPRLRQLGLRINPATRTFQALRIFLNRELEELDQLLHVAPERLAVGGRLGIITFHSLEDRRVKQAFARLARAAAPPPGVPIPAADLPRPRFIVPDEFRHGLTPSEAELAANPRSRSSRLRVLERVLP